MVDRRPLKSEPEVLARSATTKAIETFPATYRSENRSLFVYYEAEMIKECVSYLNAYEFRAEPKPRKRAKLEELDAKYDRQFNSISEVIDLLIEHSCKPCIPYEGLEALIHPTKLESFYRKISSLLGKDTLTALNVLVCLKIAVLDTKKSISRLKIKKHKTSEDPFRDTLYISLWFFYSCLSRKDPEKVGVTPRETGPRGFQSRNREKLPSVVEFVGEFVAALGSAHEPRLIAQRLRRTQKLVRLTETLEQKL